MHAGAAQQCSSILEASLRSQGVWELSRTAHDGLAQPEPPPPPIPQHSLTPLHVPVHPTVCMHRLP